MIPADVLRCQTCHRPMRADALHRPFCSLACQKRADDYADYANDAARDEEINLPRE
jgi:endogenous inhibitor of DNA gyrase (YacG/DUF329 family)